MLVWDWLVCLPKEVSKKLSDATFHVDFVSLRQWKYVWKAEWSIIKVLYLMVRYYTFVVLVGSCYAISLQRDWPDQVLDYQQ